MNKAPLISVITVVYNDRKHIEGTIRSVLEQSYPHIEYVVVDGGSDDGTLDIIRSFEVSTLISEPDKGLYDAMNKGLRAATGNYVWFLNSGDKIYSSGTVAEMVSGLQGIDADVIYGGTMMIDEEGREIGDRRLKPPEKLSWRSFNQGMVVCHQSLIVKRSIAPLYKLEYRIAGDIDWAIGATKKAVVLHHSGMLLSRFLEGGISGTNIKGGLRERFRIMTRYYGFVPTLLRHVLFGFRLTGFFIRHRRI